MGGGVDDSDTAMNHSPTLPLYQSLSLSGCNGNTWLLNKRPCVCLGQAADRKDGKEEEEEEG